MAMVTQAVNHTVQADTLIALFDRTFYADYNTRLVRAAAEPEYLPATEHIPEHRICFAHGYVASALHEIAHWCVAGERRRQLVDFGYWYAPDGRNQQQQQQFLQVEVKPQALEWVFSVACGTTFRISTDNLNGAQCCTRQFKLDLVNQAQYWCEHGLPTRAGLWAAACAQNIGGGDYLNAEHYSLLQLV